MRLGHSYLRQEKKIQAFDNKYLRKIFRISYWEHNTDDYIQSKITILWADRNVSLPLLSLYGLSKAHTITASVRLLYKAPLKGDASGNGNARAVQTSMSGPGMTIPELLRNTANRSSRRVLSFSPGFRSL